MFLVMGMKVKLKALDHGTFHCPRCGGDRAYTRMQARRWFTIFFVPVIPLNVIGTLVRCDSCGGQFQESALQAATGEVRAASAVQALRAVVAALIALAHDDPATIARGMAALRDWGMPGYGDTDLAWDRQSRAAEQARELVTAAAPTLDPLRRERFLTAALEVSRASGEPPPAARSYVRDVGAWLGLTPANVDGVLAQNARPAP